MRLPIDEAVEFMKAAAKKSYGKKGDAVVQMNWKAIDAGVDAVHKVNVPESWHNPAPDAAPKALKGPDALLSIPLGNHNSGAALLVSRSTLLPLAVDVAFKGRNRQAVAVHTADGLHDVADLLDQCIQCNQCAFVCSHATIRPFCLTADEAANAPESTKLADTKPKASEYKFTMAWCRPAWWKRAQPQPRQQSGRTDGWWRESRRRHTGCTGCTSRRSTREP